MQIRDAFAKSTDDNATNYLGMFPASLTPNNSPHSRLVKAEKIADALLLILAKDRGKTWMASDVVTAQPPDLEKDQFVEFADRCGSDPPPRRSDIRRLQRRPAAVHC